MISSRVDILCGSRRKIRASVESFAYLEIIKWPQSVGSVPLRLVL